MSEEERRGTSESSETIFAGGASAPTVALLPEPVRATEGSEAGPRFTKLGILGKGGMGRVDLIADRLLRRRVAQKCALERRNESLLLTEAQICAQLEHPSIVPVYDMVSDDEGRAAYSMRVVQGRTLQDVLGQRDGADANAKTRAQLLGILRQVCLAVDYAHSRGVVHRDLKPANVVVGEFGEVYVLDWGIAVLMPGAQIDAAGAREPEGMAAGSLGYMAPEQVRGERLDARADVFALGIMLHEILTGTRPFIEENVASARVRAAMPKTLPPPPVQATLPAPFEELTRACLRQNPENRLASARAIADAIDAYLDRERDQRERESDASALCADAERHYAAYQEQRAEAEKSREEAHERLAACALWASAEEKRAGWLLDERARGLEANAALALARAESAWSSALTRIPDHAGARRGLARLFYRELCDAELRGDDAAAAQALERARTYDDGPLRLELANESELVVETSPRGADLSLERYEREGPLLLAGARLDVVPARIMRVASGSYRVRARVAEREIFYPLVLERARRHSLRLRLPAPDEVPESMVLVPGGPFLAFEAGARPAPRVLPDFAIGRFPVTFEQYARFLDSLCATDLEPHLPAVGEGGRPMLIREGASWQLDSFMMKERPVARDAQLDVPAHGLSWDSAAAYARWLGATTGFAYRLPTALEWEKACRGADGRAFPMAKEIDYAFAKLRHSRQTISEPEPVGSFPLDESPYGVRDMAGGVSDWTATFADGQPPPDDASGGARLAVRCGNHYGSLVGLPLQYLTNSAGSRIHAAGFRLALSLDDANGSSLTVEPLIEAT